MTCPFCGFRQDKVIDSRESKEGDLILTSQRFRDQGRNVADCLAKLREMLLSVATAPRKRRPTRPSKSSQHRRLKDKKERSLRKERRRPPRAES